MRFAFMSCKKRMRLSPPVINYDFLNCSTGTFWISENLLQPTKGRHMFRFSDIFLILRRSRTSARSSKTQLRKPTPWSRSQGRPTASWSWTSPSPLRPTWASCLSSETRTNLAIPWLEETSASKKPQNSFTFILQRVYMISQKNWPKISQVCF